MAEPYNKHSDAYNHVIHIMIIHAWIHACVRGMYMHIPVDSCIRAPIDTRAGNGMCKDQDFGLYYGAICTTTECTLSKLVAC